MKFRLLLFLAFTIPLIAQKPEPSTANNAFTGPVFQRGGTDSYETSFESSEGFTTGFLGTQTATNWTIFTASTTQPTISAADANQGTQSFNIDSDGTLSTGTLLGGFSPQIAPSDATAIQRCQVWVKITPGGGADYDVAPQAPTQGFLTARVNFRFTGPVRVLDGGSFVDTGVTWTENQWHFLEIVLDPVAETLDYYLDSNLIYQATTLVGGTTIEQVVLLSDNFNEGDVVFYDDLAFGILDPCTIDSVTVSGSSATIIGECDAIDIYARNVNTGEVTLISSGVTLDGSHTVNGIPNDSQIIAVAAGGDVADGVASVGHSVPTLGEWGLIAFTMMLMSGGLLYMRRQRQA